MLINPRVAIENGWVKVPEWVTDIEKYIQPNALDFTIDRLWTPLYGAGDALSVTETGKKFPSLVEHEPTMNQMILVPGTVYDALSDFYVTVPQGVAASLVIRSSFARCGVRLNSGLYDSGFQGNIGFTLINNSPVNFITEPNTRVAQIVFSTSDSAKQYAGGWNTAEGEHWRGVVP